MYKIDEQFYVRLCNTNLHLVLTISTDVAYIDLAINVVHAYLWRQKYKAFTI